MDKEALVRKAYEEARQRYAELGVDTERALDILQAIEISMHCWQGDDFEGCEAEKQELSGGIMATGSYPGRARGAKELREDYEKAFSLIPGRQRASIHAIYLESGGRTVERDAIEVRHFSGWMDWAREQKISLDFNTTAFSHPKASGYTLSSYDEGIRNYWIEHGKCCRRIGEEMGKRQGNPCMLNHWLPDGCKEFPADGMERRRLFIESMDRILEDKISKEYLQDAIESKLFGIGVESFTVGSAELCFGYALTRKIVLTYDMGHFHPTESIAEKISAALQYLDKIMLHTSRGVRWDSDHVVIQNDELFALMRELVRCDAIGRTAIGLDFFDASINRIAAWVIGTRATQKALLSALLEPVEKLKQLEKEEDTTMRLAMGEGLKNMPVNAVWEYYCMKNGVPGDWEWISEVKAYEKNVLAKRV